HPAHFHLFRHALLNLKSRGHQITILARKKDVLEDLLRAENLPYVNVMPKERSATTLGIIRGMLTRERAIFRNALFPRKTLLIGSCPELGHVGSILRIPSIVVNEDDWEAVPKFARIAYPFCTRVLAPNCCSVGKWEYKTIRYDSYHELAY